MKILELPKSTGPREWGRIHGRVYGPEIAQLAQIRLELIMANWKSPAEEVLEVAAQHLPVLEAFDRDLFEEFSGIAEGSRVDPARLIVLNHYTDLRDLKRPEQVPEEGCTAFYARSSHGVFLGQTWDMHATAAPFVLMLKIPEPEMWVLSITGCLGMCGQHHNGYGVTINNLLSTDARVGVVWPALVRKMLSAGSVRAGHQVLLDAPIGAGHHYMLADAEQVVAVETSGRLKKTVYSGQEPVFYHTNHCVDNEVAACSTVSDTSTTYLRYDRAREELEALDDPSFDQLWNVLGSKNGYPQSIFTNMATAANPAGMFTCARILMAMRDRRLVALSGLEGTGAGLDFSFETSLAR